MRRLLSALHHHLSLRLFGESHRTFTQLPPKSDRAVSAERPRRVLELRPDLRDVFPFALCPPDRGKLLEWWKAETPFGVSAEECLALLHEMDDRPDRGLARMYRLQPSWQEAVPLALSPSRLAGEAHEHWNSLKSYLIHRYRMPAWWLKAATLPDSEIEPQVDPTRGVNVIAHLGYPSGLQQAAMGLLDALRIAGIPVSLRSLPVTVEDTPPPAHLGLEPYDTTIYLAAVNSFPDAWYGRAGLWMRPGVRRIAVWYWETEEVPAEWVPRLQWPDEVWAPTRFLAEAFGRCLAGTIPARAITEHTTPAPPLVEGRSVAQQPGGVLTMLPSKTPLPAAEPPTSPQRGEVFTPLLVEESSHHRIGHEIPVRPMLPGVELPPFPCLPRSRFCLRDDRFVFLFTFDMNSTMERKNPLGLIAAFRRAFAKHEPVELVVKVSRGKSDPTAFTRLRDACTEAGVILLNETMPRAEVLALFAACDCYVSLHRAEGFGLGMAEAMLLGKPVIATDYSGIRDFTTPETSYLVRWTRTTCETATGPYPAGAVWAEPDVGHAAELMRQVFDHRDEAHTVAERGRTAVLEVLSMEAYSRRVACALVGRGRAT